jgi:DNA-binding MarR family transcriptional regulator
MNQELLRNTIRNISILSRKVRAFSNRKVKKYGLNNKTIQMLRHIKHNKGITQKELCDIIKKDKSAIARGVSHLEAIGLIQRETDAKDKRIFRLYITNKGQKLLPILNKLYTDMAFIALDGIDESTLETLNEILLQIENNILEHVQKLDKEAKQ